MDVDHVVTKIRINVTFSIFRYVVYKLNFYIIFAPFEVLCFLATYIATDDIETCAFMA